MSSEPSIDKMRAFKDLAMTSPEFTQILSYHKMQSLRKSSTYSSTVSAHQGTSSIATTPKTPMKKSISDYPMMSQSTASLIPKMSATLSKLTPAESSNSAKLISKVSVASSKTSLNKSFTVHPMILRSTASMVAIKGHASARDGVVLQHNLDVTSESPYLSKLRKCPTITATSNEDNQEEERRPSLPKDSTRRSKSKTHRDTRSFRRSLSVSTEGGMNKSKEEGKYQKSIQLGTTPDPGHHMAWSDGEESEEETFDDGYDENLMGDEEDRKILENMTELQREMELFDRFERRCNLIRRFEIKKRLNKSKRQKIVGKKNSETLLPTKIVTTVTRRCSYTRRQRMQTLKAINEKLIAIKDSKMETDQKLKSIETNKSMGSSLSGQESTGDNQEPLHHRPFNKIPRHMIRDCDFILNRNNLARKWSPWKLAIVSQSPPNERQWTHFKFFGSNVGFRRKELFKRDSRPQRVLYEIAVQAEKGGKKHVVFCKWGKTTTNPLKWDKNIHEFGKGRAAVQVCRVLHQGGKVFVRRFILKGLGKRQKKLMSQWRKTYSYAWTDSVNVYSKSFKSLSRFCWGKNLTKIDGKYFIICKH